MKELLKKFNRVKKDVAKSLKTNFPSFFKSLKSVVLLLKGRLKKITNTVVKFFKNISFGKETLKEDYDETPKKHKGLFGKLVSFFGAFFDWLARFLVNLADAVKAFPGNVIAALTAVAVIVIGGVILRGIVTGLKFSLKNKEAKNKVGSLLKNDSVMSFFLLVIVAPTLQEIVRYEFMKRESSKNSSLVTLFLVISDILKQKAMSSFVKTSSYKGVSSQTVVHVVNHIIQSKFKDDPSGLLIATIIQILHTAFNQSFVGGKYITSIKTFFSDAVEEAKK